MHRIRGSSGLAGKRGKEAERENRGRGGEIETKRRFGGDRGGDLLGEKKEYKRHQWEAKWRKGGGEIG